MPELNTLLVELKENILIVTLNRSKAMNALNVELLSELRQTIESARTNDEVRAIMITGSGAKAFAAGADIKEIQELNNAQAVAFAQNGQELFRAIENFPKPVLAAVNGFALGGGCELAMACHLRVASDNARFGQPEINLGIIPGYGGTQRLTNLIGRTRATEMLLTGDNITADVALNYGLINAVTLQGELVEKSIELLKRCLKKSPLAIRHILECVNANQDSAQDGYETEARLFGNSCGSHDGKEGVSAFIEKREPSFTGA